MRFALVTLVLVLAAFGCLFVFAKPTDCMREQIGPRDVTTEEKASAGSVQAGNKSQQEGASAKQAIVVDSRKPIIALEQPAYVGMPVWVQIQLPDRPPGTVVRYPIDIVPWTFGNSKLEVRLNGVPLLPIDLKALYPGSIARGFIGLPAAPKKTDRLPLHLLYRFDQPGTYEVRYTLMGSSQGLVRNTGEVIEQSDWTRIVVRPSSADQRRQWLQTLLSNAPRDTTELLSDFLPSLLASHDDEVLDVILRTLFAPSRLERLYAFNALAYFPKIDNAAIVKLIESKGPTEELAYWLSWRRKELKSEIGSLTDAIIPFLKSSSPLSASAALQALGFLKAPDAGNDAAHISRADAAVLEAADHLRSLDRPFQSSEESRTIAGTLAVYLGGVKTKQSRDILWKLATSGSSREQAWICLAWIGDPEDLPRLTEVAIQGTDDNDGRAAASLPYHLRNTWKDQAIPYLEAIVARSRYPFARFAAAEELAQADRRTGFAYLLDIIQRDDRQSTEAKNFIRDRFLQSKPSGDADVVEFLKAKLAELR